MRRKKAKDIDIDYWIRNKSDEAKIAQGYTFNLEKANHIVDFAETFCAPIKGILIDQGKPFKLFPFQKDLLMRYNGWRAPDGTRAVKRMYVSMARQNSKSFLNFILALYELMCADYHAPFIGYFANKLEEVKPTFKQLKYTILGNTRLNAACSITASQYTIDYPKNKGTFQVLSTVPTRGLALTLSILDEYAYAKNDEIYNTVVDNARSRSQGCVVMSSTAGTNRLSRCYSWYQYCKAWEKSDCVDPNFLGACFEAGENDDPFDWDTIAKANPSLACGAINRKDIETAMSEAKYNKNAELNFKNLTLNNWITPSDTFLDLGKFELCGVNNIDLCLGEEIYAGGDFSATKDLAAISWICYKNGKYHFFTKAWTTEAGLAYRAKKNLSDYKKFIDQGSIEVVKGDYQDEKRFREFVVNELDKKYKLKAFVFDPNYCIGNMISLVNEHNINCLKCTQSAAFYTSPMNKLADIVGKGELVYDKTKDFYMFGAQNLQAKLDRKGLIMPAKDNHDRSIDHFVALLMAMTQVIEQTTFIKQPLSFYDNNPFELI